MLMTLWSVTQRNDSYRIGIVAHGDYCDAHYSYVTKRFDFSTDQKKLCDFAQDVGSTGKAHHHMQGTHNFA